MKRTKNIKDLDSRIKKAISLRNQKRKNYFTTSDHTRDVAGSVQHGLYLGQLALGIFRNLTNYHFPLNKRVKKVAITLGVLMAANFLRKKFVKKTS